MYYLWFYIAIHSFLCLLFIACLFYKYHIECLVFASQTATFTDFLHIGLYTTGVLITTYKSSVVVYFVEFS